MGLSSWFMGFGLVGSIAQDILKKYILFKSKEKDASETELLKAVWDAWFFIHGVSALTGSNVERRTRAEIIMDQCDIGTESSFYKASLVDVFVWALYIEANVGLSDGSLCKNAIKVFEKKAQKNGLDFAEECNCYYRTLNRLAGKVE